MVTSYRKSPHAAQGLYCSRSGTLCVSTEKEFLWPQTVAQTLESLDVQLKQKGFQQSTSNLCIYTSKTDLDGLFILAVYVDAILLTGKSEQRTARVKADLGKFNITSPISI